MKTESQNFGSALPETQFPYSERNGVGVEADIEALFSDPEVELSDQEKEQMYAFAHGLFDGRYEDLHCESTRDLEEVHKISATADQQEFYDDYFHTEEGRADLAKLGLDEDASWDTIHARLLDVVGVNADVASEERKAISARSKIWYRTWLADWMRDHREGDEFVDQERAVVHYNPEKFFQKVEDLSHYRKFYRQVQQGLNEVEESPLKNAEQVLLDIHRGRVNAMMAGLYGDAFYLAEQIDKARLTFYGQLRQYPSPYSESLLKGLSSRVLGGSPHLTEQVKAISSFGTQAEWERRLVDLLPALDAVYHARPGGYYGNVDDFSRRLDMVRNGTDWAVDGEEVKPTPISHELEEYVRRLSQKGAEEDTERRGRYAPEVVAQLDKVEWGAEQFKAFLEAVLKEWELLSEHTITWQEAKDRDGFAPDEKYQVIIDPNRKHFSVDSSKRVIWISEKFARTLTNESPAGILPLAAHELAHVRQSIFDYRLGEKLPLARIKGRRNSAVRESGGIDQEQIVQREYFGRDRKVNLHYLYALQAKLAGENKGEVARTFYESYIKGKQLNERALQKARELAADRALRLYRDHDYDSQPLAYIEQGLIAEQLASVTPEQKSAFLIATGSFNTRDSAQLKKIGMLELPTELDVTPAHDVMRVFERDFMQDALASVK